VKISNELQWMLPFVEATEGLIDLSKITKIKGYKQIPSKEVQTEGCTHYKNGKFLITIKTHNYSKEKEKYKEEYKGLLLDTLAHELAHIHPNCFDHGYEHFAMQVKILQRFVKVLKKTQIELWD